MWIHVSNTNNKVIIILNMILGKYCQMGNEKFWAIIV